MINSENSKERSPSTSIRINKPLHAALMAEARENHITLSEVITRHVVSDMKKAKEVKDTDFFKEISNEEFVYNCLVAFGINRNELRDSPIEQKQFCDAIKQMTFKLIGYSGKETNKILQRVLEPDYISRVDVADTLYRYLLGYTTNEYQIELGVLEALRDQYETTYKQPQEKPMGCM